MLLKVELIGGDTRLTGTRMFKEAHKCDGCGKIYSFSYSSSADLDTMTAVAASMAKQRQLAFAPAAGDICELCKQIRTKGYCQFILI